MRVVFMGTPHFAVPALRALLGSPHTVVAAYSQPPRPAGRGMKLTPSPVHQLAEAQGIPVFTPTSLKDPAAQAQFAAHNADVAVVAAYGLLLPQAVLGAPRHGCINIHPSDLPRWRGAAPLQRTLMAGDATTACCIMQMEAGLDTGPVLLREPFPIPPTMDFGGLHDAMAARGAALVLTVLAQLAEGRAVATPQTAEGVTYAAKVTKDDQWLDFRLPANALVQRIRALSPAPGALARLGEETVKIFAAHAAPGQASALPGTALDDRLTVACAEGTALAVTALQRPGKARQEAAAFLQGRPVPAGTVWKSAT